MHRPALSFKDWVLVAMILGLLFSLSLSSYLNRDRSLPDDFESVVLKKIEWIPVSILGAVKNPGVYQVEKGTLCQGLLDKIELLPDADLSRVLQDKKLRKNQVVLIPFQGKVTVFVEGAIANPGPVHLPLNSKMSDLKGHLTLLPTADMASLNRRRILKLGEKITIPHLSKPTE